MVERIATDELKIILEKNQNFQLIEVLPETSYSEFHLPQAINIPFDENFARKVTSHIPKKDEKIVVYCKDVDCNASSRAAQKLEELGYERVYDYEAGKVDWKEHGHPVA